VVVYQFGSRFTALPRAVDSFRLSVTIYASTSERTTLAGREAWYCRLGTSAGLLAVKGSVGVVVQGPLSTARQELSDIVTAMLSRIP
jgi:hypothetical protein